MRAELGAVSQSQYAHSTITLATPDESFVYNQSVLLKEMNHRAQPADPRHPISLCT
jgi:hypothetical protein